MCLLHLLCLVFVLVLVLYGCQAFGFLMRVVVVLFLYCLLLCFYNVAFGSGFALVSNSVLWFLVLVVCLGFRSVYFLGGLLCCDVGCCLFLHVSY